MKKLVSCVMTLALLCCTCPFVVVAGNTAPPLTFTAQSVAGMQGETVEVQIRADNNTGLNSYALKVDYDTTVLELIGTTKGDFTPTTVISPVGSNPVSIAWTDGTQACTNSNGVCATLTFQIKDNAPFGKTDITLSMEQADTFFVDEGSNFIDVPFALINGSVTVSERKEPITFAVDTVSGAAGEEVNVRICTQENPGISSFNVGVVYDTETLQLLSCTAGDFVGSFEEDFFFSDEKTSPFHLYFSNGTQVITANAVCATLSFKIKETAPAGFTPLTLIVDQEDLFRVDAATPGTFIQVPYQTVNGGVTVTKTLTKIGITTPPTKLVYNEGELLDTTDMVVTAYYNDETNQPITDYTLSGYEKDTLGNQTVTVTYGGKTATFTVTVRIMPGDVNNDDKVNTRDVAALQQHLSGWEITIQRAAADVNGDGKINTRDVALLQQSLSGWAVTLQ